MLIEGGQQRRQVQVERGAMRGGAEEIRPYETEDDELEPVKTVWCIGSERRRLRLDRRRKDEQDIVKEERRSG